MTIMTQAATQETAGGTNRRYRPTLKHLFYAMALIGASIASFGVGGIVLAGLFLGGWLFVYADLPSSPQAAGILVVFALITVVFPVIDNRRPLSRSETCRNNLRQLSLALESYHNANGRYPPPFIADANGRPMHSWRMLILPYLEGQDFIDAYDFDQPWDSPHNLKLATQSAGKVYGELYSCAYHEHSRQSSNHTRYFAVVGPSTVWANDDSSVAPDGESNTILLIEDHSRSVLWTEPIDLSYQEAIDLVSMTNQLGSHPTGDGGYRHAAFANGEIARLIQGTHAEDVEAVSVSKKCRH